MSIPAGPKLDFIEAAEVSDGCGLDAAAFHLFVLLLWWCVW